MISLKRTISQLTVLASLAGMGSLVATPALADNHLDSSTNMNESSSPAEMETGQPATSNDIIDVASGSESFEILVNAVQAAALVETLEGSGPYTVFAPTDEAFSQLPDGALEYLLQPENQDLLQQVLTYHVVSGEVTSDQISTGVVEALGGGLAVRAADGQVVVNNASVINADIQASNGVIHAVNRVLLPETLQQALANRLGVQEIYQ